MNIRFFLPFITLLFSATLVSTLVSAQKVMKGRVQEIESKAPMFGVYVENVNQQKGVMTDSFGNFELEVNGNDLVEIQKFTYETIRLRVPNSAMPKFYILDMNFEIQEMDTVVFFSNSPQHVRDSIKKTEIFRSYINHYRKEDINPISNPFDFLSKRNKQIWAFQKAFDFWEREKFLDYVFNDKLILKITDLNEDALVAYKHYFRPTYEQFQSFSNEYDYYMYIKQTSIQFLRNKEMHDYKAD